MISFSILIPNYGTNIFFEECLLSVKKQQPSKTYQIKEIIICDQNNDDEFVQIDHIVQKINANISIIRQSEKSTFLARSNLVKKSTGEYLIFIDSDDTISADYLSRISESLISNNYPDVLLTNLVKNTPNKVITNKIQIDSFELMDLFEYGGYFGSVCCKIFKRKLLDNVQDILNVNNLGEDWIFSLPIMKNSKRTIYDENINGYFYRENNNSVTHNLTNDDCLNFINFRDNFINRPFTKKQKIIYVKSKFEKLMELSKQQYKKNLLTSNDFTYLCKEVRKTFPKVLFFNLYNNYKENLVYLIFYFKQFWLLKHIVRKNIH